MPLNSIGALVANAGSSGAVAREARESYNESSSAKASSFSASSTVVRGNADDGPPKFVANYLSPFIRFDSSTRLTLLQYRDSETGDVLRQYPSPRVVKEYAANLPEPSFGDNGAADQEPRIIGAGQDPAAAPIGVIGNGSGGGSVTVSGTGSSGGGSSGIGLSGGTGGNPALAAFSATANSLVSGLSSRQVAVA
ncbi:hypothetical protein [Ferrovibrio sp.]|uniref:hypothetical protein n=1 Tax=Ferrovibrio sp. TaxID=1917215 RepID=UPI0035B1D4FA